MSEKKREDDTITTGLRETGRRGLATLRPIVEENVRAQEDLRREARLLRFEAHRAKRVSRQIDAADVPPKAS